MVKTNVMRILEKAKLSFRTMDYKVDENDLSGEHAAIELNMPPEKVFKTLVLHGDKTGYFVCCIPVNCEVDLKLAAKVSGNKSADMIPMKDLVKVTGYMRGGCSPIGMKKKFPAFIDESALALDEIAVSAGVRGTQILMDPTVLMNFIEGTPCNVRRLAE